MTHSPLLRTSMRLKLDRRSVALVDYELALEDVSINLQQPPNKENFDESRWADLRKTHENKEARETRQKQYEDNFVMTIMKERKFLKSSKPKSSHNINLLRIWEKVIPAKSQALRLTLVNSGFVGWEPPLLSDCLLSEQGSPAPLSYGRVCVKETGILDRRLLHHAISPKYIPKLHFKMERKRLEIKSAEFAAFVAQQTSSGSNLLPRPQDESSDEGLLSANELKDLVRSTPGSRKRKCAVTSKPNKRTRKPPRFIKLYDCKAHDRSQLKAQAINGFSLMQQTLPRVESPSLERVGRAPRDHKIKSLVTPDVDRDTSIQDLTIHGIILPVKLPGSETTDDEQEQPAIEEEQVARYRTWRSQFKSFFEERDKYMQSRVYRERAPDRELLHSALALVGFWSELAT
ncbi:hypothetical protein F4819DRAFT_502523 [Hypoxylon fuscum]|nr:hypothetical protein F4819DRAFT_502523 [Hypoxylon fuscum]